MAACVQADLEKSDVIRLGAYYFRSPDHIEGLPLVVDVIVIFLRPVAIKRHAAAVSINEANQDGREDSDRHPAPQCIVQQMTAERRDTQANEAG